MARADNDLLTMALVGYEAQKAKIDATIRDIQSQLGHRGSSKAAADGVVAPAKRVLSASARRKIAAAQRKRWAAQKKQQGQTAALAKRSLPKKRKISPAARKRMAEATRRRWAEYRAKKAKSQKG